MRIHANRRDLHRMLDAEFPTSKRQAIEFHLAQCQKCSKEARSLQTLRELLRHPGAEMELSAAFDGKFWSKVDKREREPWYFRLAERLESLIPTPSLAQAAAVVMIAFLVGSAGGVVSYVRSGDAVASDPLSVPYLSGFKEYKGVSTASISINYLKMVEESSGS